jgi:hypothetical protein
MDPYAPQRKGLYITSGVDRAFAQELYGRGIAVAVAILMRWRVDALARAFHYCGGRDIQCEDYLAAASPFTICTRNTYLLSSAFGSTSKVSSPLSGTRRTKRSRRSVCGANCNAAAALIFNYKGNEPVQVNAIPRSTGLRRAGIRPIPCTFVCIFRSVFQLGLGETSYVSAEIGVVLQDCQGNG